MDRLFTDDTVRFQYKGEIYRVGLFGGTPFANQWYMGNPDDDVQGSWSIISDRSLEVAILAWHSNTIDMPIQDYLSKVFGYADGDI